MKGIILEGGKESYTYFGKIFRRLKNHIENYNWLITDCEAYPRDSKNLGIIHQFEDHAWASGDELINMVEKEDFQWIWGVLSGFEKSYSYDEVMKYELPYVDENTGFWQKEISVQHPLAVVELVAWDSSLTLLISKEDSIVDEFRREFPLSKDLVEYNSR